MNLHSQDFIKAVADLQSPLTDHQTRIASHLWIQRYTATKEAWEVANMLLKPPLLGPPGPLLAAAQLLNMKTWRDAHQLTPDKHAIIMRTILDNLCENSVYVQMAVARALCVSLANLFIYTSVPLPLSTLLVSLAEPWALEFCNVLGQQCEQAIERGCIYTDATLSFKHQIGTWATEVLAWLQQLITAHTSIQLTCVASCFTSWVRCGALHYIESTVTLFFISYISSLLASDTNASITAAETLVEVLERSPAKLECKLSSIAVNLPSLIESFQRQEKDVGYLCHLWSVFCSTHAGLICSINPLGVDLRRGLLRLLHITVHTDAFIPILIALQDVLSYAANVSRNRVEPAPDSLSPQQLYDMAYIVLGYVIEMYSTRTDLFPLRDEAEELLYSIGEIISLSAMLQVLVDAIGKDAIKYTPYSVWVLRVVCEGLMESERKESAWLPRIIHILQSPSQEPHVLLEKLECWTALLMPLVPVLSSFSTPSKSIPSGCEALHITQYVLTLVNSIKVKSMAQSTAVAIGNVLRALAAFSYEVNSKESSHLILLQLHLLLDEMGTHPIQVQQQYVVAFTYVDVALSKQNESNELIQVYYEKAVGSPGAAVLQLGAADQIDVVLKRWEALLAHTSGHTTTYHAAFLTQWFQYVPLIASFTDNSARIASLTDLSACLSHCIEADSSPAVIQPLLHIVWHIFEMHFEYDSWYPVLEVLGSITILIDPWDSTITTMLYSIVSNLVARLTADQLVRGDPDAAVSTCHFFSKLAGSRFICEHQDLVVKALRLCVPCVQCFHKGVARSALSGVKVMSRCWPSMHAPGQVEGGEEVVLQMFISAVLIAMSSVHASSHAQTVSSILFNIAQSAPREAFLAALVVAAGRHDTSIDGIASSLALLYGDLRTEDPKLKASVLRRLRELASHQKISLECTS